MDDTRFLKARDDNVIHDRREKCICGNVHGIGNRIILVFAVACIMMPLIFWNAHLQQELARVRYDVDVLMKSSSRNLRPSTIESNLQDDVHEEIKYENQKESVQETDVGSALISTGTTSYEFDRENRKSDENNLPHSIMKRNTEDSAGTDNGTTTSRRGRRGRKKQSRNKGKNKKSIARRPRKNKAIAIHVKASRGEEDGFAGFNIPGKVLTDWQLPNARNHFGFGTTNLLSEGYITVPVNGMYFVYSQVIFLTSDLPEMVAEIGVGALGATTFAKCEFSQSSARNGSFVACHSSGVVYLRQGDGVSLIVNPPNVSVHMAPEYTYFGAFLVGL